MLGGILVLFIVGFVSFSLIDALKSRYPFLDASLLRRLFFFHVFLAFVYYLYASFNPSDSVGYYNRVLNSLEGETWGYFYGTSTTFVTFVAYPFIKYLGFSYEACMALFAFLGFLGFLYFYIFFRENIRFKHTFFGLDLVTLIFFLPNLHFWSSSLGKGSIIFFGIGLFFFGISNIRARWLAIFVGGVVVYHVRPHILLVMLVSSAIGFVFTSKAVSLPLRVIFLCGVSIAFYYIYSDVLKLVGIDEDQFLSQGLDLTRRASELTKATSGVDITSYSMPMQIFTFLYRPLFIDAPGLLGIIVSFENVFYLLISLRLVTFSGMKFLITANYLVKTAFFSFITVSIALAQISGNLGLAIRQKSQVMILLLFVVVYYLDSVKSGEFKRRETRLRLQRIATQPSRD